MSDQDVLETLESMQDDPSLVTEPSFTINKEDWPDGQKPFVDTHLGYLKSHSNIKPEHYLSNLKIMLKRSY